MKVVEHVFIQASLEDVWGVLTDVERWHSWTPTVLSIEPLEQPGIEPGLKPGARYRVTQPRLRPGIYEVTLCEPLRCFNWELRLPGGAMVAEHELRSAGSGVEGKFSFSTKGLLANLLGRIYARLIAAYVATEARSLKARCENGAASNATALGAAAAPSGA